MQERATPEAEAYVGLLHKVLLGHSPDSPLVLLVHGRAGTFDVMWAFRRCIPDGANIIALQAPLPDPVGGFSWWPVDLTIRGFPYAAIQQARETLRTALRHALEWYHLRPRLTLAFGFSQGAGLVSSIIQESPELFRGVALLAGFVVRPPEEALPLESHGALPAVFIAHGTQDQAVALEKAELGRDYLISLGYQVQFVTDPVEHKVGSAGMRALRQWTEHMFEQNEP